MYCRYDTKSISKEEAFKIQASKLIGSRAIIRHHNPAYEGIINSAFIPDQSVKSKDHSHSFHSPPNMMSYHQFNNGHLQPIYYLSDTETERSAGEIDIPLKTFGVFKNETPKGNLILDASKL